MHDIILTELGVVIYENKRFLKAFPFNDPVADYTAVRNDCSIPEKVRIYLSGMDSGAATNDRSLLGALERIPIDVHMISNERNEEIQSSKPEILIEAGLARNQDDAMNKLRDFALNLSSSRVTEALQSPDMQIIQAINALDDIDKIVNIAGARMREWYGLHFPELDNIVDGTVGYSHVVTSGSRTELTMETLEDAGFSRPKAEMIMLIGKKSRGGEIAENNLRVIKTLAEQVRSLHTLRRQIEDEIESAMHEIVPNLAAILGIGVGARFLARAGSLKKLATMPASSIQILGAERALFRSLKTGSQPPKHGLLFQHPLVHSAPRWQRGKLARAIASKAAIAARVDAYGGGLNTTLLEKLNVRIGEIGEKNAKAPDRPSRSRKVPDARRKSAKARSGRKGGDARKRAATPGRNQKKRRRFGRV